MSKAQTSPIAVRFRGVRGSLPSPGLETTRYGGNTSCVEVRAGDDILILDAGTGLRSLGSDLTAEFGTRPLKATILISHTHWDHIQGLPFFAPGFVENNEIGILAAPGKRQNVERALGDQMKPLNFPVSLNSMLGLASVNELSLSGARLGAFTIRAKSLNHPGGCAGFRIESKGASLAYLPDHEPFFSNSGARNDVARGMTDALVEFVHGVDLLILDTQYTSSEYPARIGWGHGCLPDSVALGIQAGVKQLALFHHDPAHNDDQVDGMVAEGARLAGAAPMVVTGASENVDVFIERSQEHPITTAQRMARVAA